MLEKFESLPRDQQAALAAQYGLDLDELRLRKGDGTKTSDIALPGEPLGQSLAEATIAKWTSICSFRKNMLNFKSR